MEESTLEYIDALDDDYCTKYHQQKQYRCFDETIIGEDFSVPTVIRERKDSAGRNTNVL